jgi:hypothetical protein
MKPGDVNIDPGRWARSCGFELDERPMPSSFPRAFCRFFVLAELATAGQPPRAYRIHRIRQRVNDRLKISRSVAMTREMRAVGTLSLHQC